MSNLRELGRALRQLTTCPTCSKSIMVRATAWRGHGTGKRNESYYSPRAHEQVSVETHCTCPGGPCDHYGLLTQDEEPAP